MKLNSDRGAYATIVDFAKKYVAPDTLENVERSVVHATTCIPFTVVAMGIHCATSARKSYDFSVPTIEEMCSGIAILLGGVTVGMMTIMQFNKRVKGPFIQNRISEAIASSKEAEKTMLIFKTSLDPLGSFLTHTELCHYERFAKTHSIEVLTADTKMPLKIKMSTNNKKYDEIIIKCHADSKNISVSKDTCFGIHSAQLKWFNKRIKDNGIIVFEGSLAGAGEDNIARQLSKECPRARVFASFGATNSIEGISYDGEGVPSFHSGFLCKGEDTTRLYQNGKLIFS